MNQREKKNTCIFDTDILLDTLTKLINEVEGKRVYLRQYDIHVDTNRATERKIYRKFIQWRDKSGQLLTKYDLGVYEYQWSKNPLYDRVFREQILFIWDVESFVDDTKGLYQQIQFIEEMASLFENVNALIVCSPSKFKDQSYIVEFIRFLINYRIEHQLIEITEEQMDEALTLYITTRKEKEKEKALLPN